MGAIRGVIILDLGVGMTVEQAPLVLLHKES